jgi:hypothetical protein
VTSHPYYPLPLASCSRVRSAYADVRRGEILDLAICERYGKACYSGLFAPGSIFGLEWPSGKGKHVIVDPGAF